MSELNWTGIAFIWALMGLVSSIALNSRYLRWALNQSGEIKVKDVVRSTALLNLGLLIGPLGVLFLWDTVVYTSDRAEGGGE